MLIKKDPQKEHVKVVYANSALHWFRFVGQSGPVSLVNIKEYGSKHPGHKLYNILTQWAQTIKENELIQNWIVRSNLLSINKMVSWVLGDQNHQPFDPNWTPFQ